MIWPIKVPAESHQGLLVECLSRRSSLELSCRLDDGWASFRSRFLGADASGNVVVEYPSDGGEYSLELTGGESVGVAFRRGHKKCIFDALVIGHCRFSLGRPGAVPALKLARPEDIFELQRRVYYRAPVPQTMEVPVELCRATPPIDNPQGQHSYRGKMVDVSASGLSVSFPVGQHPRWEPDTVVECAFRDDSARPPLRLVGRLRYCEKVSGEQMRLGMQFPRLESSPDERDSLRRLLDLCTRFQRLEMGRLRPANA